MKRNWLLIYVIIILIPIMTFIINNNNRFKKSFCIDDYEVSETYRLRKANEGYCTLATLRADWAPYKFKFADENWSNGTNFGYLNPPGVLKEGSRTIPLNPPSSASL